MQVKNPIMLHAKWASPIQGKYGGKEPQAWSQHRMSDHVHLPTEADGPRPAIPRAPHSPHSPSKARLPLTMPVVVAHGLHHYASWGTPVGVDGECRPVPRNPPPPLRLRRRANESLRRCAVEPPAPLAGGATVEVLVTDVPSVPLFAELPPETEAWWTCALS